MFRKHYGRSLISSIFIVLCSFLAISEAIDFANELWGTQLRLISAIFAEKFLLYTGFNIERNFTILKLSNMTFDIIPACNGSKAIKVTMISSCLIALISKDLKVLNKIKLVAISLPLAILLNGLRISALITLSSWSGVVIHADTFAHTILGLIFFSLAIFLLTKLSDRIIARQKNVDDFSLFYPCLFFIFVSMIPFLSACFRDWKGTSYNNNDQLSIIFFLWGLSAYLYHAKLSSKNHSDFKYGTFLTCLCLLGTSLIYSLSPSNYILGIAFLMIVSSLNLIQYGAQNTRQKAPLLIIIFLGFPKTNEKIMELCNVQLEQAFFIKFIAATVLSFIVLFKYKKIVFTCTRPIPDTSYKYICLFTCLLLGIQVNHMRRSNSHSPQQNIYYPYYINNWEGFDLHSKGHVVLNRLYKKDGVSAGILIISSQGNRKNIHTPEYCQFGLGWNVSSREKIILNDTSLGSKNASKLELLKEGSSREFIYWFESESYQCATYSDFISKDTLLRLQGQEPQWHLVIVWSDELKNLEDFAKIIPGIQKENQVTSIESGFPQNNVTK
jgi:exosortase/archaeosortase family protein